MVKFDCFKFSRSFVRHLGTIEYEQIQPMKKRQCQKPYNMEFWHSHMTVPFSKQKNVRYYRMVMGNLTCKDNRYVIRLFYSLRPSSATVDTVSIHASAPTTKEDSIFIIAVRQRGIELNF